MKLVDREIELKVHGYDPVTDIITPNKTMIDFGTFIEDLHISERKYSLGQSTKKEVLTNSKEFLTRHFKLHKVPYKGEIRCKIDKFMLRHLPGIEEPLKFHNKIRYIDPFNLPVSFTSSSIIECMVVENITFISVDEFINRMLLSYRGIILPPQINELTESSYVHELTHTQLAHQKGIIKNYYNSEVLSIFLELLNIYESSKQETLLPLQDAMRLTELYDELYRLELYHQGSKEEPYDDLIEASKYTESIFKAYNLFVEYYYGSIDLRKYILKRIQDIFNGNLQLEDLLTEFDITIESSISNPKLTKYFKR